MAEQTIPLLKRMFYFFRNRVVHQDENQEYSGGYYSAMIRLRTIEKITEKSGQLLDVGCGEGLVLEHIHRAEQPLPIGLDPWWKILTRCSERLTQQHKLASFIAGSAFQLPLAAKTIDGITCVNLLLNLPSYSDVEITLRECARVLKPDGILIFDVRNRRNWLHLLRYKMACYYDDTLKTPLNTYYPAKIEELLKELQLEIVERRGIGFPAITPMAPIFLYTVKKRKTPTSSSVALHPPVSLPVEIKEGFKLLVGPRFTRQFVETGLSKKYDCHVRLVGTGQTALYLLLKALSEKTPSKTEVIMPSYTAPSVHVTIRSAGFTPRVVDIMPDTFQYNMVKLEAAITEQTMAIVHVHPFGIPLPLTNLVTNKKVKEKQIPIIEDNAQGFGSRINGEMTGSSLGLGFASFNRGKNMPTEGGGILFVKDERILASIDKQQLTLTQPSLTKKLFLPLMMTLYAVAVKPLNYGLLQKLIRRHKQTRPPEGTPLLAYSHRQATCLLQLLPKLDTWNKAKKLRAIKYMEKLKNLPELTMLKIHSHTIPAFNRFPIFVSDPKKKAAIISVARENGFELSDLYIVSIPEHFPEDKSDTGWEKGKIIAQQLITLPVQPSLSLRELERLCHLIIDIMQGD